MYGDYCNCDGRYVSSITFNKKRQDFDELMLGGKLGWSWVPTPNKVTHWMYMPELPDKE